MNRNSLHNAHDRLGGYNPVQAETGLTEERAVFGFCAFLASREHQHDDVLHLALMRGIARRQDRLDNQEAAIWWHDFAAVTEDGQTLLFAPVVNDVREQIGVASGGHSLKEIALLDRDSCLDAARLQQGWSVAHHMGAVVEDTARRWMLRQDRASKLPVAPPTSTIVLNPEKSHALATAGGSAPW